MVYISLKSGESALLKGPIETGGMLHPVTNQLREEPYPDPIWGGFKIDL
jgi:hypothetical protein